MDQPLTPARMEERRALMIRVLEDMRQGITHIKPFVPPPKQPRERHKFPAGNQAHRKSPQAKVQTKIAKLQRIAVAMAEDITKQRFETLRDRYYTEKSALKRYCQANGLEMPEVSLAPISTFPGAKPRFKQRIK